MTFNLSVKPPPKPTPRKKAKQSDEDNIATKITREQAFQSMLDDEELSDIELHGKDGSVVHANRGFLAARSSGRNCEKCKLNLYRIELWGVCRINYMQTYEVANFLLDAF